jgi:hypothetical protein
MADSLMVVLQDLNLTLHRYRDENSKLVNLMRLVSAETRRRKAEDCLGYTYYTANVSNVCMISEANAACVQFVYCCSYSPG